MTLNLLQQVSKMTDSPSKSVVVRHLDDAWKECDNKKKRELFFCIVFSLGDINNREHNLFKKQGIKNPDNGGSSLRKVFLYCLEWIHNKVPEQFYNFLPIYGEYYNLGANTMYHMVWTDRYKGTVKEVYRVNVSVEKLTDYIASVLLNPKITDNERKLWAKWLWHIPTRSRKRKFVVTEKGLNSVKKKYDKNATVGGTIIRTSVKHEKTREKDAFALRCINSLSQKMGWEIKTHPKNLEFKGYKRFRKPHLLDSEATMFSSQSIKNLDKIQLLEWFNGLPSGARFNVQRRLLEKDDSNNLSTRAKWINTSGQDIGKIYLEWLSSKETAQQALRDMSTEEKEKLSKEDPNKLKDMTKAAKVNTGATKLIDVIAEFLKGGDARNANLMAQSIMDKIKLEAPVLVCDDISGSMGTKRIAHNGVTFYPKDIAALATTLFLLKNPREDVSDMFIRFDTDAEVITGGTTVQGAGKNRFVPGKATAVGTLIDRTRTFLENYREIAKYTIARGSTAFNRVAVMLKTWVDEDGGIYAEQRKEAICQYPVFLVISDGDMNGMGSAEATMRAFQHNMLQWFGWDGLVVVWDVKLQTTERSKFDNLENVIYQGGFNEGILNQILCNIGDQDIIDIYTSLKSIHTSNRYQPVRDLVL